MSNANELPRHTGGITAVKLRMGFSVSFVYFTLDIDKECIMYLAFCLFNIDFIH